MLQHWTEYKQYQIQYKYIYSPFLTMMYPMEGKYKSMDLIHQHWQVADALPHVAYDLIHGQGELPVLPHPLA